MCRPDKVLIITPFYPPNTGGAETFAEDLAKALSKEYLVHICTIKWEKPILWEGMDYKKALKLLWKLLPSVWKMTRKYKYYKIYALGLIPSFICFLLRLKYSAVMLALYDFKRPNFFKTILNRAEKVFVEGRRGEEDMLCLGLGMDKLVKFQHWVDQGLFSFEPRNNDKMKVIFVGRPIKIKGKHVIEECAKLTPNIEYEYLETCPHNELPGHFQKADVCVVPSLYSEGFSRVVVEAASCGCVVVASNYGALPELINPFGRCIDPAPEKFAQVLTQLSERRWALDKLQIKTLLYARQHFSEKNAEVFF